MATTHALAAMTAKQGAKWWSVTREYQHWPCPARKPRPPVQADSIEEATAAAIAADDWYATGSTVYTASAMRPGWAKSRTPLPNGWLLVESQGTAQ